MIMGKLELQSIFIDLFLNETNGGSNAFKNKNFTNINLKY
jgi:hypothetical protein